MASTWIAFTCSCSSCPSSWMLSVLDSRHYGIKTAKRVGWIFQMRINRRTSCCDGCHGHENQKVATRPWNFYSQESRYPSMPLGTAGLRELIRRPAGRRRRSFYSNFDWLKPTKRTNGPNGRTDLSRIPPLPTAGPQDGTGRSLQKRMLGPSGDMYFY